MENETDLHSNIFKLIPGGGVAYDNKEYEIYILIYLN